MELNPWLPQGLPVGAGLTLQSCLLTGDSWQLFKTSDGSRMLFAHPELAQQWLNAGLLSERQVGSFVFGQRTFITIVGGRGYRLEPVEGAETPTDASECEAFVSAIRETRRCGTDAGLHDAVYVERLSRLLPCYSPAPAMDDATVAGAWISGGVRVSLASTRRMRALVPWLDEPTRRTLASQVTGTARSHVAPGDSPGPDKEAAAYPESMFVLPGRPALADFFNEHVVDLIRNEERYRALGITFPGAILLHGPPGCGKTFAVEKLVEFLDWPCFSVDSGSIGSPYIHETGKKIADIFEKAAASSPSIVVIDEVDAFLAARDSGASGQHRVEEVAEFLRSIPNAAKNSVLVIGMTNRLESLDPAIVRRGRFDHIIDVGMPTEAEVLSLLSAQLAEIPHRDDIELAKLASRLAGRPLSDAGFVVREACRLAAKSGSSEVANDHFEAALASAPSRIEPEQKARKIGFV